jgi:hypothetical protein
MEIRAAIATLQTPFVLYFCFFLNGDYHENSPQE